MVVAKEARIGTICKITKKRSEDSADRKFIETDFLLFAPYNKRRGRVRELSESDDDRA
jgi:hypothetical protein